MKRPVKPEYKRPAQTIYKSWTPYEDDSGKIVFLEEEEVADADFERAYKLSVTELFQFIHMVVKTYDIPQEEIMISAVYSRYYGDIQISIAVEKPQDEYQKELDDSIQRYNDAIKQYEIDLKLWDERQRIKKLDRLTKELQKLQGA